MQRPKTLHSETKQDVKQAVGDAVASKIGKSYGVSDSRKLDHHMELQLEGSMYYIKHFQVSNAHVLSVPLLITCR